MLNRFLHKILAEKRQEILKRQALLRPDDLKSMIRGVKKAVPLECALRQEGRLAIIAEMKKASPSEGIIRKSFDPGTIAREYVENGADAISVLTEENHFLGSLHHIHRIRPLVHIPILRKDFIIDPYQVLEARAFGADAVLLILAILDRQAVELLLETCQQYDISPLVEVHNEREMERALELGVRIIGINNRNLDTFEVDLSVTERLAGMANAETILVAESGIHSPEEVKRMAAAGVDAILVGTHFMRATHPGEALKQFRETHVEPTCKNLRHHAA